MRLPLFKLDTPESLKMHSEVTCNAKFKVLDDIQNFQNYSRQLLQNSLHVDTLIEKVISFHVLGLPKIASGREIYSHRKQIEHGNTREISDQWVDQFTVFKTLVGYTLGWIRFSKACCQALSNPTQNTKDIATRWEISPFELNQLVVWYNTRGEKLYGIFNSSNLSWHEEICDEEARFKELYPELRNHASKKLAGPSFRYLSDLYEGRDELIWRLMDRAWQAILFTSHKPITESLKLAKAYINTEIHHIAIAITSSNNRQVYNSETNTYEIMELGLIDNQEMDASKHEFLWSEDEGFATSEIQHTLDTHLTPKENELVKVLGGFIENPEFEEYAKTKPDRRMACFEYYGIQEQDLKDFLPELLCGVKIRGR